MNDELDTIIELLGTIPLKEVAAKWGVSKVQLAEFLASYGYTASAIKRDYRHKWVKENPNATIPETAKAFGCCINAVHVFKRGLAVIEQDRMKALLMKSRFFLLEQGLIVDSEIEKWRA